ncbi:MAG TPA: toll/interleukin-1 receptor domain-containing protein [Flavisolibacter sp.]|nr:toll/interleukin-1 receptor domain-containing protein [Flavisolibacter sp.]
MPPNQDDKFWDLVQKRIEEEKCILILGPDISVSDTGRSLNEQLKNYLEKKEQTEIAYYTEDEFFSFKNKSEKEYAIMDIQAFYKDLSPCELHGKIADIPFHLIISVSPDHLLKDVFDSKKLPYQFAFYNKEQNTTSIQKPGKACPLLYLLFGDIETDGSLIFTYEDLFNYLVPSTGRFELPLELQQELQKARLVLFIGFKFEKWYFKLLLRLLNLHQDKINSAPQLKKDAPPLLRNFYAEQFKVDFLQYSEADIINRIYDKCKEKGVLRTKTNNVPAGNEIFISYAWGGESEAIVDSLYATLTAKGYNVIRDKIALGYKGNIKKFMETIGRGKCVIVVMSDKYLKSENCMFEMLELQKNNQVYERIFPIVLSDANIYDELARLNYFSYWSAKTKELNDAYTQLIDKAGTNGIVDKINLYSDIRRVIDQITVMLGRMNTLTPDLHQSTQFAELIRAIDQQLLTDQTNKTYAT